MKIKFSLLLVLFLVIFSIFFSCQDEEIDDNNFDELALLDSDSELANFISAMSLNFGSYDDFLDSSSCFSLELPITIILDNDTLVIETLADLQNLQDVFETYEDEDDFFEFVFPLTIIFSDYTEIVIENEEALQNLVEECVNNDDDNSGFDCVDFIYPISFSIFETDFSIAQTVNIQNDQELYAFIASLSDEESAVIASLNYPVTLIYGNGEEVQVNSNQELEEALAIAYQLCEDTSICSINTSELEEILQECTQEIKLLDLDNQVIDELSANFYNQSIAVSGIPAIVDVGEWLISQNENNELELTIQGLQTHTLLNGVWQIIECNNDYLKFTNGNNFIKIDCLDDDQENCDIGASALETLIMSCDFWEINLHNQNNELENEFYVNFNNGGEIAVTGDITITETGMWSISESDEGVQLLVDGLLDFEPLNGTWTIVLCDEELKFSNNDNYIYLECDDDNEVIFDCYDNYNLEVCDEQDGVVDSFGIFDLDLIFANCPSDQVVYAFYLTLEDAQNQLNPLMSPLVNTSNPQFIFSRVSLVDNSSIFEIFEYELNVVQCEAPNCTEVEVDNILQQCTWIISSYNGSDNLDDFYILFQDAQNLLIEGQGLNIYANWSTAEISEDVVLTLSNVSGPNIQAINGDWLVVECSEDILVLHSLSSDDEILLERNCD